ncbi:acyl-CoA N-acyltransferase [Canariomyces notabilis]|uniref:Acyl-CoA N-acyltransferase n=1 Tax=Canariomyces notabilis TaxID=2074819 RepID=A0AAN6THV1_9PEZI|nr:acyl-CoA N-acyltransferase [Canariomyces arenarius]
MATWRAATLDDVKGITQVADEVHRELPESEDVFAERVKLFPEGCLVLVNGEHICGYAISHPIRNGQPPALDSMLGTIASDADQYYIHDVSILPTLRGNGLASACINKLLEVGDKYSTTCLISVYGTAKFWRRFGFMPGPLNPVLSEKLRGYGEDAAYLLRQNSAEGSRG